MVNFMLCVFYHKQNKTKHNFRNHTSVCEMYWANCGGQKATGRSWSSQDSHKPLPRAPTHLPSIPSEETKERLSLVNAAGVQDDARLGTGPGGWQMAGRGSDQWARVGAHSVPGDPKGDTEN